MSENTCNRCGRELIDPNADYGWRCAKKIGVKYGSDSVDWELRGFRVAVEKAESFLKRNGLTIKESERENFYKAVVNMMVATYYDDVCAWEDAFWHMYYALFPNDKSKNGKTDAVQSANMQTILDLVKWINETYFRISKSTAAAATERLYKADSPDMMGEVPRYWTMPISPYDVLVKMESDGYSKGSIRFWTEELAELGGKSRMEAWTFPINPADIKGDGISFNFGDDRSTYEDEEKTKLKTPRSHAAIDIHTNPNSPVQAVTDGIVVYQGKFYDYAIVNGVKQYVYQVVVLNFDGSITRYGEMWDLPIATGTLVRQGDVVGYTKKMTKDTMLHIEVFDNIAYRDSVFKYDLSDTGQSAYLNVPKGAYGPYDRRNDLVDSTMIGALRLFAGNSYDLTLPKNPNFEWRR